MNRLDPAGVYDVAIAVPARSEAKRITACLKALEAQPFDGLKLGVFVLCNNCADDTAGQVRRFAATASIDVHVREVEFSQSDAHAGTARRSVMRWARTSLKPDGAQLLCATDADSRVAPDWLSQLLKSFRQGVDAVAGSVRFDAAESALIDVPPLRGLEDRYAALQAQVQHLCDPRDHDPWPNHLWAWGANLAVKAQVFDRVGGVPAVPLAEDRAFMAQLERVDALIRHAPDVEVVTSARSRGRAPGGLADLVASHTGVGDLPCDAALEPIAQARRRASLRNEFRRAYHRGDVDARLLRRLRLPSAIVGEALEAQYAGEAWRRVETCSPFLTRCRLPLAGLPQEIARAERLVASLSGVDGPDGTGHAAATGLWSTAPSSP